MGGLFGGGPKPEKLPPAPPPAMPPTLANPANAGNAGAAAARARAAAGAGFADTIATGAQGLTTPPSTAPVSLLGGTSMAT